MTMGDSAYDLLTAPINGVALPHIRTLALDEHTVIELCWIPPGSCRVGSRSSPYFDDRWVETVVIEHGFWLGRTAFTRGQWRALFGEVPEPAFAGLEDPEQHPMVNVTWFDALDVCSRLQARFLPKSPAPVGPPEVIAEAKDDRAVTWTGAPGFRLPSEFEWEYACRAGGRLARGLVEGPFGDGDELLERTAWIAENAGERTHAVDQDPDEGAPPHPFGLRQVIGNVNEWCLDLYWDSRSRKMRGSTLHRAHGSSHEDEFTAADRQVASKWLKAAQGNQLSPVNARAVLNIYEGAGNHEAGLARLQTALDQSYRHGLANRVVRGGSWNDPAGYCRSANRFGWGPDNRLGFRGFRVCLLRGPSGWSKP